MVLTTFGPARADSVVTLCQSDRQGGSGTNLATAVSAGDDNHKVEIVRSTFDNNGTDDPAGLTNRIGAISLSCSDKARNCTIKVSNSKFSKNRAENGAAMVVSGAAEVSLRGSRFEGNVAKKEGGAIHYTQRSDKAPANPRLEMLHTVFTDNSAEIGGAVRVSDARIVARAIAFSKNRAAQLGGAIASQTGPVQIDRGVFLDNSSDSRGAVSLFRNRQATISNTIIARNTSRNGNGVFTAAAARFINSTIVDNVGIGIQRSFQGIGVVGSIRFRNTIIANNSAGNCRVFASGRSTRFIDDGTNLQFPDTSCGESIPVANPHLDKLYLPVFGSPPWSRGHNPTCLAEPVAAHDVYNKVRPLAIACSIGAAEGDLEKEVADRTVGGANWPDGLNNKDGSPKIPPSGLPTPQQTPDSSRCCCLWACRR
jgi:predicted outer membrane repeat protein